MVTHETIEILDQMNEEQFEKHALDILRRELGPYGLARFIHSYRKGSGNYTEDRHQWLDGLSVADFLDDQA